MGNRREMDEKYQQAVINNAVAAIISNGGFSRSNTYSINVLANMAERFMKRMATTINDYTEIGRTIPNLSDVSRTFEEMEIKVEDLHTYIRSVGSYTLPFKVPKLPVAETRLPEPPTPPVDNAGPSDTEKRREELAAEFPNYVEIMAEEQRLAADRTADGSFNNTFDSLASGVMSLRDPSRRRDKSKKSKKKKRSSQRKSTTKKGGEHDFAAPSSSLWLSRKRSSGGEIVADFGGESPPAVDPPAIDPPAIDPPAIDPPAIDPPAVDPTPAIVSSPTAASGDANDGEAFDQPVNSDDEEEEEVEEPVYIYEVIRCEGLRLTLRRSRKQ